jgi:short-subunit dehydrogenase
MYSASKHAVKGFTDALRIELQHDEVPVSVTLIQPGATDTPFPQHARNYMEREPALPTPLDDPFDVAKAILEAATTEKRSIKVSGAAKMNTSRPATPRDRCTSRARPDSCTAAAGRARRSDRLPDANVPIGVRCEGVRNGIAA